MLVFLDTEFTDFTRPELISLALVSEDGREFYAERTDYQPDDCNDFVLTNVLPLLGRIPGAACNQSTIVRRLRAWFEALPESATIVYDFSVDWLLLADAFLCREHREPPANVGENLLLVAEIVSDPVYQNALNRTFTREWPPDHALADARAMMAGYRAWSKANRENLI